MKNTTLSVRNPNSTRPWQFVLEPLSGYLWLASKIFENKDNTKYSDAWNFGPDFSEEIKVKELIDYFIQFWGKGNYVIKSSPEDLHEANYLKLDCSKAFSILKWHQVYNVEKTVSETVDWYDNYYSQKDSYQKSLEQIENYEKSAKEKKLLWTLK